MEKIEIHLKDKIPVKIEIDGKAVPIDAFFLTTAIPDRSAGHFLSYGNTDTVGSMLFSFWRFSVRECPEMAETMELVAKDILETAQQERGTLYEEMSGSEVTH